MEEPDFWDDPEKSQEQTKELKSLKDDVAGFAEMTSLYDDIETLIEMGYEENDASLLPEIEESLKKLKSLQEAVVLKTLLSEDKKHFSASTRNVRSFSAI